MEGYRRGLYLFNGQKKRLIPHLQSFLATFPTTWTPLGGGNCAIPVFYVFPLMFLLLCSLG